MQLTLPRLSSLDLYRRTLLLHAALVSALLIAGGFMAATAIVPPVFHFSLYLTGIPDPMCGMRTGTVALMSGQVAKVLWANPLSLFFTPLAVAFLFERLYRFRTGNAPRRWTERERRLVWISMIIVLLASWLYQLFRFGII